jgi:hypothetical protein
MNEIGPGNGAFAPDNLGERRADGLETPLRQEWSEDRIPRGLLAADIEPGTDIRIMYDKHDGEPDIDKSFVVSVDKKLRIPALDERGMPTDAFDTWIIGTEPDIPDFPREFKASDHNAEPTQGGKWNQRSWVAKVVAGHVEPRA